MKIEDFLKEFPNKWRRRIKDNLLSQVNQELGEGEAKKRLMELKTWFERLEDELDEPMDSNLKNDLFFGFLIMFDFRNEGIWFKENIAKREDSRKVVKYSEQLQRLAKNVPKADVITLRREWQQKFLNLVKEWNEEADLEWHKRRVRSLSILNKVKPHFAGRAGQEIPEINKKISHYLRERLAEKLKGRRVRPTNEDIYEDSNSGNWFRRDWSMNEQRRANDQRAAQLITEIRITLGIKLEHEDRLKRD